MCLVYRKYMKWERVKPNMWNIEFHKLKTIIS